MCEVVLAGRHSRISPLPIVLSFAPVRGADNRTARSSDHQSFVLLRFRVQILFRCPTLILVVIFLSYANLMQVYYGCFKSGQNCFYRHVFHLII